jgi:NAD(P)-dependent dehydrogenase (short-subunit alcohol dehydrogenase family)
VELRDRVALITGSKRIGAAVAIHLARHGWMSRSPTIDRRQEAEMARGQREERPADGLRSFKRICRRRGMSAARPDAVEQLRRLDVLINLASVYAAVPFEDLDEGRNGMLSSMSI